MTLALNCYEDLRGAPWRASSACNAFSPSWWSQPRSSWRSHKTIVLSPLWSALVVCPNFTNKKKSRNCMKSPAWKDGGHAWHCQLPGWWTGSTRSIRKLGGIAVVLYLAGLFTPRYSRDLCSPCICWRHCIQPAGGNRRKSRQIMHTASDSIWNAKQLESEPPVYPALIFSGSLELACLKYFRSS